MHKFILIILSLKDYLKRFFGDHYPNEIVQLIILASHKSFKIHGGYHYTFLMSEKTYIWGCNSRNELRFKLDYKNSPQELPKIRFSKIKCGYEHMVALTPQSELYVWGRNNYGQLGLDNIGYSRCGPIPYKLLSDIKKIYCGREYTIVITKTRSEIYVWGGNEYGQLGLGNNRTYCSPQKLQLSNVTSISCGVTHAIAFAKNSNKIYVWGTNHFGELGLGDNKNYNRPTELFLPLNVLKIRCGQHHTIALSASGKLFVWGENSSCELGLGDRTHRNIPHELLLEDKIVIGVSCGMSHTMVLTNRGEIYGWGDNASGQLESIYDSSYVSIPTKISLDKIMFVSCGAFHTIAVTIYNDIFVWGYNEMGQLGIGDYMNRTKPRLLKFKF